MFGERITVQNNSEPKVRTKGFFWARAVSMYKPWLRAMYFAKRTEDVQLVRYSVSERLETFGETPGSVFESLDYPDTLSKSSFGLLLRFMLSTLEGVETLKNEANLALRNPINNASDESYDKRRGDAERSRYESKRQLLMEHLENDIERVCATRTRAAVDVWLSWLSVLLYLHDDGRHS